MAKLVALRVEGTFEQGFQIWMELGSVGDRPSIAVRAALPAAPIVLRFYQEWQSVYRSLSPLPRIKPKTGQITNVSLIELSTSYQQAAFKLHHALNRWLKSSPFRPIREKLLEQLTPSDEGQILLQTENLQLRQLPWHLWDIFDRYPHMELVLSTPEYERPMLPAIATYRDKVRILAILGDSTGINLNEDRALLEQLSDAETTFLVEPKREQLTEQLWDQPWDILFFAGHSHSQPDGQRGYLHINRHDRLAIDELEKALLIAVRQGLKIALFNSCEGLGLVHQLEGTQIPHIIVMREPVPDPVAQLYLKYFLKAFSHGELLHLAVRHAREKLQGIESKFPCVTWLPVLCSHPTAAIATWQTLGHRPRPDLCPYRGLFTFREADAPFFFGREAFTKLLFESIHRQSLVAIIGASGSGKSSVVFAGLVPQLRQQDWQIITLRPGNRPLHALAMALLAQTEPNMSRVDRLRDIRELTVDLQTEKTALRDVVDDLVWQTPGTRLLLIVDQFEELYTLCRQVKERQVFLDRLLEAVQYCLNFTLVITLRADFMGQALSHRLFADALQHQSLMLGPMTTAELQQAIEQPALRLNVRLEDGLTARILHTISGEPGKLPLLEFALTQLWQQQVDNLLTHAAYDQMGGIEAALGCYAEEVYDHLNEEQKERSRRIFMQLVQPGEGTADTRRVATTAEIGSQHWDLVTQLADARLLVTNRDETTEEVTVELVHEALIQNWERLRLWIDLDRAFRTWQERLRVMFRQWQISRYDREALLRGAPLAEAEGWLQSRPLELNRTEREFIEKSRRLRSRQRQRLLVGLCCGLVAALTLAGIAGWQWQRAEQQRQVAFARQLAAQSSSLIQQNTKFLPRSMLLALESLHRTPTPEVEQTLRDGLKLLPQRTTTQKLPEISARNSFSADGQYVATIPSQNMVQILEVSSGREVKRLAIQSPEFPKYLPFDPYFKLALSQNIQYFATSENVVDDAIRENPSIEIKQSPNSHTQIWNVKEGRQILDLQHNSWTDEIKISPTGKYILLVQHEGDSPEARGEEAHARLWEISSGRQIREFKATWVNLITFSLDSQYLAIPNKDKNLEKIEIWKIATGQKVASLGETQHHPLDITFSPDNQFLAVASVDQTVRVWQVNTKREVKQIVKKQEDVNKASFNRVAFSSDGTLLLTESLDREGPGSFNSIIQVWSMNDYREVANIILDNSRVLMLRSDGRYLTAYTDSNIYTWDILSSPVITSTFEVMEGNYLNGGGYRINNNGRYLTVTRRFTERFEDYELWDILSGKLVASQDLQGHLVAIASHMNSPYLATSKDDHLIKISQVNHNQTISIVRLEGTPISASNCSVSPDPMFTASFLTPPLPCSQSDLVGYGKLYHAAFSPDGKRFVTISGYNFSTVDFIPRKLVYPRIAKIQIWDTSTGQLLSTIQIEDEVLLFPFPSFFSRDGQYAAIVTAIDYSPSSPHPRQRTIRVWEVATGREVMHQTHTGVVNIDFTPDIQHIILSNRGLIKNYPDNSYNPQAFLVSIWQVKNQREIIQLNEQSNLEVYSLDGRYIITGDSSSKLRLWTIKDGHEIHLEFDNEDDLSSWREVVFSPNAKFLAATSYNNQVIIWQTANGRMVHRFTDDALITALRFSASGQYLAVANEDNNVRVRVPSNGTEVILTSLNQTITNIDFTPDEKHLVLTSDRGLVQVIPWKTENLMTEVCQRLIQNLSMEEWQRYLPGEPYRKTCPNLP